MMEKIQCDELGVSSALKKQTDLALIREEIKGLKDRAIHDKSIIYDKEGKFEYALAPNGERSNLSEKRWLEVRTASFKKWFGDWERYNDLKSRKDLTAEEKIELDSLGKTVSKIVDDNGEPLVVYHGTMNFIKNGDEQVPKEIEDFSETKVRKEEVGEGFYFVADRNVAENYCWPKEYYLYQPPMEVYLKMANPGTYNTKISINDLIEEFKSLPLAELESDNLLIRQQKELKEAIRGNFVKNNDGVIAEVIDEDKLGGVAVFDEGGNEGLKIKASRQTHYVVFKPTQIKSAKFNNCLFDAESKNING